MLFNSYEFIFLLLPIAWLGCWLLSKSVLGRNAWLLICSLFFYSWWNPIYVPLLLASIAFNYFFAALLRRRPTKLLLACGICANIALLAYFKYAYFFSESLRTGLGIDLHVSAIALPLAISFITFQKIAYLVDCYQGDVRSYTPIEFGLFASFFPQLIAGPIVHHGELIPQMIEPQRKHAVDVAVGSTIFFIGLFKKAVIADGIAPYANSLFSDPRIWESPTFFHAWIGVLAYGVQIYFDFSGYSDMAIGAARTLGIRLPLNFYGPYRATSINDFWRRWHMTLSRFLRDYLYIPLGGNRYGMLVRYRNLIVTMLLGGFWHGAGWTFVVWGLLHGIYLVVQHCWSNATKKFEPLKGHWLYRAGACAMTFLAVQFAWAYFRASSIHSAHCVIWGMLGFNGVSLPAAIGGRMGVGTSGSLIFIDTSSGSQFIHAILWISTGLVAIFVLPTTQEFLRRYEPALDFSDDVESSFHCSAFGVRLPFQWIPNFRYALVTAIIATFGILSLPEVTQFLYFQF